MTADRKVRSSPRAAPGWYELGGDALDRVYWDGSRWLARARFAEGAWQEQPLPDEPGRLPRQPTSTVPVVPGGSTGDMVPPGGVGVFGGLHTSAPDAGRPVAVATAGAPVAGAGADVDLPPLGAVVGAVPAVDDGVVERGAAASVAVGRGAVPAVPEIGAVPALEGVTGAPAPPLPSHDLARPVVVSAGRADPADPAVGPVSAAVALGVPGDAITITRGRVQVPDALASVPMPADARCGAHERLVAAGIGPAPAEAAGPAAGAVAAPAGEAVDVDAVARPADVAALADVAAAVDVAAVADIAATVDVAAVADGAALAGVAETVDAGPSADAADAGAGRYPAARREGAEPGAVAASPAAIDGGSAGTVPPASAVDLEVTGSLVQRRWTVALRGVLLVPQVACLAALAVPAVLAGVAMWLAALASGRVPERLWAFAWGHLQWSGRVAAYALLLTDRPPPYRLGDAAYPARLALSPPAQVGRADAALRLLVAWPASLLAAVLAVGVVPVALVGWVAALVRGRLPDGFHQAFAAVVRFEVRAAAFGALLTASFPAAPLGDDAGAGPGALVVGTGGRSVLAWSFVALPALAVAAAVAVPAAHRAPAVSSAAVRTGVVAQQPAATAPALAAAAGRYIAQAHSAEQAVLGCSGTTAAATTPGGVERLTGTPAGGMACVAPVLRQWQRDAEQLAAAAGAIGGQPAAVTVAVARLRAAASGLAKVLGATAADTDPLAMLGGYEHQVLAGAAAVANDAIAAEAQLAAA